MNDDRIHRYLSDRADAITLSPANADEVMRRGNRRRNRRRGAVVGGAAIVGLVATIVVIRPNDEDQSVQSDLASSVVPSPLDWTEVQPDVGLGYSTATVQVDGAVYGLSTAPGAYKEGASYSQHLYTSTDGKDWGEVALPDGVTPSSLASDGDTLYAVGTAPAGGNTRDLVLAASHDGAAHWSTVTLPHDVADLEVKYPGKVSISQPSVAAKDDTHQVAAVTVSANLDPRAYNSSIPEDANWQQTADGITVYAAQKCEISVPASTPADPANDEAVKKAAIAARGECSAKDDPPNVIGTYTWDELGVPAELQALIGGRTYLYSTTDGQAFERAVAGDVVGFGTNVVATDDGYRAFVGISKPNESNTTVLRSVDGHTWTADGSIAGSPMSAGLLGGRPAVAVSGFDGGGSVQVEQADGTWVPLDVSQAVDVPADRQLWISDVAFGPLGMAAVLYSSDKSDGGGSATYLVHSADGSSLSVLDVADAFDHPVGGVLGVTVTADAITLRVSVPDDQDATTPPSQTLLVGTPH